MGEQMMAIDQLVAQDDARIKQQLAGIALTEAEGAAKAIRDAEEDRAAAITQGVTSLGQIASGLSSAYAEGNFGGGELQKSLEARRSLRQSEGVAAPDTRVGRRQMRQGERGMQEDLRRAADLSGFGFDMDLGVPDATAPDPYTPPGMTRRELNQARRGERQALNQQRRDLGLSRDEFAQRRADAAAFVPYEQEQPSGQRVMREDLDPANRVGSVFGDPNIPDVFGPYARNTMTMYDSFSDMPRGPRPLPPGPPNLGQYSGLGFPSYLMYQ